jgi:hypothetical protein
MDGNNPLEIEDLIETLKNLLHTLATEFMRSPVSYMIIAGLIAFAVWIAVKAYREGCL